LGAGKPALTCPSNQGFYQSLWDALDKSNRSLKRANKASATRPGIIIYAHCARAAQKSPIVTIATRVVRRGQANDSRRLEGGISKPWIPCRVDWGISF
jgi:hypothetical protein